MRPFSSEDTSKLEDGKEKVDQNFREIGANENFWDKRFHKTGLANRISSRGPSRSADLDLPQPGSATKGNIVALAKILGFSCGIPRISRPFCTLFPPSTMQPILH